MIYLLMYCFLFLRYVVRGYRKPVTFEDLCQLRPGDRCKALVNKFYQFYLQGRQSVKRWVCLWINLPSNRLIVTSHITQNQIKIK